MCSMAPRTWHVAVLQYSNLPLRHSTRDFQLLSFAQERVKCWPPTPSLQLSLCRLCYGEGKVILVHNRAPRNLREGDYLKDPGVDGRIK